MRRYGRELTTDDGFTLVELMITLIIVSILLAIAIPTFLSARERASDRSAQARTNTGLKAHKAQLADNVNVSALTAAELENRLQEVEPSTTFEVAPAPGSEVKGVVYVRKDANSPVVALLSRSESGRCYWTRDDKGSTTFATAPCGTPFEGLVFGDRWTR